MKKNEVKQALNDTNAVEISGTVQRVLLDTDKMQSFVLACKMTEKVTVYPNIKVFDESTRVEEKDRIVVRGNISTGCYEKKDGTKVYETFIKAVLIEEMQ